MEMLRDKKFFKNYFLWEIFASVVLHIQRPPLVLGLRIPAPLKPFVMWKKFISSSGKMSLTKRTFSATDIKEETFWFDPSDADWDQAVEFAEKLGL